MKLNYITVYGRMHGKRDKPHNEDSYIQSFRICAAQYCQEQPIKVETENARNTEMLCGQRQLSSLVAGINGNVL
jgi:hypothetical protein